MGIANSALEDSIKSQWGSATDTTVCDANLAINGIHCLNGQVIDLSLSRIGLTGTIPVELSKLSNLQRLIFSFNDLSGAIPAELGKLTALKELRFFYNDLSGPIPAELGNLTALQTLDFYGNNLSGSIPKQLGKLTFLRGLDLNYNNFNGAVPIEIESMINDTDLQNMPRQADCEVVNLRGKEDDFCFTVTPYLQQATLDLYSGSGDIKILIPTYYGSAEVSPLPNLVGDERDFLRIKFTGDRGTGWLQYLVAILGWRDNQLELVFPETIRHHSKHPGNTFQLDVDLAFRNSGTPDVAVVLTAEVSGKSNARYEDEFSAQWSDLV